MCIIAGGLAFFNPCITLAFLFKKFSSGKMTTQDVKTDPACIGFQVLGAIFGTILAWGIIEDTIHFEKNSEKTNIQAFFMEFICTLQIILTLMMVSSSSEPMHFGIFSIMVTTYVAFNIAGPISMGCLNPSVCSGINIGASIITGSITPILVLWLYILAPLSGTLVAIIFFGFLSNQKPKYEPNDTELLSSIE